MPSFPIYDMQKKKVGSIELSDAVFAGEIRPHLLNDAVRAQVAWHYEYRTGKAKTRTEVVASGKKIYRQKGTGQARHGDIKAPIFVGGGKAHGPRPRRVRHKINKKVMRAALVSALSLNHKEDRLVLIEKLELPKPNTKSVANCLKAFGLSRALFINGNSEVGEQHFNISAKNIAGSKLLRPEGVNVFDVLKYKHLIVSKMAAQKLVERLTHV